jgi:hypothetical protein
LINSHRQPSSVDSYRSVIGIRLAQGAARQQFAAFSLDLARFSALLPIPFPKFARTDLLSLTKQPRKIRCIAKPELISDL